MEPLDISWVGTVGLEQAPGAPGRHDLHVRAPDCLLNVSGSSRVISVLDTSLCHLSSVYFLLLRLSPQTRQVVRLSRSPDIFPDSSGLLEPRSDSWTCPPRPAPGPPALGSPPPLPSPALLLGFQSPGLLLATGLRHPCPPCPEPSFRLLTALSSPALLLTRHPLASLDTSVLQECLPRHRGPCRWRPTQHPVPFSPERVPALRVDVGHSVF